MSTYWPREIPLRLDYPAVGVGELLAAACRRFGERVAVVDGDEELTFGGLLAQGAALAGGLCVDGIGPGATVDPQQLSTYVAERVVPYKKLREVHIVDRLPTNPAGKILKAELRARL